MEGRGTMTMLQANERVYLDLYGLREPPFSITPDPEYLYLARTHQSALEKILYGISNRLGFMLLTGEVGTGKTTLCRHLLDQLNGQARTVYIVNPALTVKELLATILDDLGVAYPVKATKKNLLDLLYRFLLETDLSRPVVIIIDDAQAMPGDSLENLRLLSNLETDKSKLLQVLLTGQPELEELIARPELRQLRQRISLHCQLELLSRQETEEYIARRLITSGSRGSLRFSAKALDLVQGYSSGVPRLINKICDYALVAGYVANDFTIETGHIQRAVLETGTTAYRAASNNGLRGMLERLRASLFGRT